MVQPSLLFAVPVQIQTLQRGETYYDEDLREQVQDEARSETKTLMGMVMWLNKGKLNATDYGAVEQSDGYVVFSYVHLKARQIEIKREDRFLKLGTIPCDLYVVSLQPIAHHSDIGGPGLVKAFFRDRQKSRNSPGV